MLSEFQLFTSTWRKTPSNRNVGSAWKRHLTLTSDQRDPNSWRTRSFSKSKKAWMTASSPIYKSHKKSSYWRVGSAPTRAYVVSRGWTHMNRVIQTRVSVPGKEKVRG